MNIVAAFDVYKKAFQIPIFLQTIDIFIHCLLYLHVMIEIDQLTASSDISLQDILETVAAMYLADKKEIFQIILCYQHECFYKNINAASKISAIFICGSDKEKRRVCKLLQETNRNAMNKMLACQLILVDFKPPLRLFAVIVNYTALILQFALQKTGKI
ncbi:uncharacterized protein LOC128679829 [Plodia interpunctella]|uniref:uncharacterized protein LOC128679829 n=1 Tax=Plodia interpunctella TaxID=58824 RepID=UPI002368F014|nr:uncharacterized protein LOC128679829 [Plodia interpunctella]